MAKVTREKNGILSTFIAKRINIYDAGGKPSIGVHSYEEGSVGSVKIGKVANSDDNFTIRTTKMLSFTDSEGTKAGTVINWITELYEKEQEAHLVVKEREAEPLKNEEIA